MEMLTSRIEETDEYELDWDLDDQATDDRDYPVLLCTDYD